LFAALDANHDGVIDATEIGRAPEALKALDRNGDRQLSLEESFGQPPGGRDGGLGGSQMGNRQQRMGGQGQRGNRPEGFGQPPSQAGGRRMGNRPPWAGGQGQHGNRPEGFGQPPGQTGGSQMGNRPPWAGGQGQHGNRPEGFGQPPGQTGGSQMGNRPPWAGGQGQRGNRPEGFGQPPGQAGGSQMGNRPPWAGGQGQHGNRPEGFGQPPGQAGGNAGRPLADRQPQPQRSVPPLIGALDANHDGVVDATEMRQAIETVKALDKNGDGQLTPDELMPHQPGDRGAGNRPPEAPKGAPEGQQ
jgi:hypothetical protein